MKRGDIVTVAAGGGYGSKPRPAVVIQSDAFALTGSITIALLTSRDVGAPLVRVPVPVDDSAGLSVESFVMLDKLITVPRNKVKPTSGRLSPMRMRDIDRAAIIFLGLVGR